METEFSSSALNKLRVYITWLGSKKMGSGVMTITISWKPEYLDSLIACLQS